MRRGMKYLKKGIIGIVLVILMIFSSVNPIGKVKAAGSGNNLDTAGVLDFEYNGNTFSVEYGHYLDWIISNLGINGTPTKAVSSNPKYVSVDLDNHNNRLHVKLEQAFSSQETITVTVNGEDYVLKVKGNEVYYRFDVLGILVTSKNKDDILGDGKVSYDPGTNILKLDNATLNSTEFSRNAIVGFHNDLIIEVNGSCSILNNSGRSIYLSHDLTFIGDGSLTISGSLEGIVTSGNVYFTGPNITILSSQGVSYADKLLISCGNITIDGSASYNNKCIGVNEMIVTGGYVYLAQKKADIITVKKFTMTGGNLSAQTTDGYSAIAAEEEVNIGDAVKIQTPEIYTFVQDERIHGWEKYKYSLGDGDGNRVSKAILVTVAGSYAITFDGQGGYPAIQTAQTDPEGNLSIDAVNNVINNMNRYGYRFMGWSETPGGEVTDASALAKNYTSTKNYYAVWEEKEQHSILVTNDENGTAASSVSVAYEGDEVTLTAEPKQGYKFKEWQVIQGGVTISDNKFVMGDSDVEIKAVFEAESNGNGNNGNGNNGNGNNGNGNDGNGNNGNGSEKPKNKWEKKDQGWQYYKEDGNLAKSEWLTINNVKYYFNSDGLTASNEWVDGKWINEDGSCTYEGELSWKCNATGWWVEDSKGWYPVSSWQKINGIWYYFNESGYMASEEYYNGYWFNADGSWDSQYFLTWKCNSTGWWVEDISGWWPASRWLKIDGCWYYFDADGYMVTSQYIDGYWIDADGVCR